jgi:class 3 adenylate cyclase
MQRRARTPTEAARYWALNQQVDVRSVLGSVKAPTLVLHTTGDAAYPIAHGRYVADHVAGARFVELPGTDHFGYAESGDRVVTEIEEFVTGTHSWPAAERRLASILFTDVVDSTCHLAEVGDRRWHALLDAHDRLVDVEVERHRGRVVTRTGDGCVAVFDGPREALLCGQAILAGAEQLGLELRAGTHTGEIELRGDDIAGMAVHLAARVSACAGPGQLLATRTVRDLVAGSTFSFVGLGEHEMKGVAEPWELYRLEHS